MRHTPAAMLPAADFTGSGSDRVDSKASSKASTPTFAAVSPNLGGEGGGDERVGGLGQPVCARIFQHARTSMDIYLWCSHKNCHLACIRCHSFSLMGRIFNKNVHPQKQACDAPAERALHQRERHSSVEPWNTSLLPQRRESVLGRPAVFVLQQANGRGH